MKLSVQISDTGITLDTAQRIWESARDVLWKHGVAVKHARLRRDLCGKPGLRMDGDRIRISGELFEQHYPSPRAKNRLSRWQPQPAGKAKTAPAYQATVLSGGFSMSVVDWRTGALRPATVDDLAESIRVVEESGSRGPYCMTPQDVPPILQDVATYKTCFENGRLAAAANMFAVQWTRSAAGRLDPATGLYRYDAALESRTLEGVWCQFRLNDSGDDIEILLPPQKLRQQGYENGPVFCRHESARTMITSLAPPVPYNKDATEWAVTQNLGIGCAAMKYRFNPRSGRYEWVETGPVCRGNDEFALSEPVLAKASDSWVVGVRVRQHLHHVSPDWAGGRHKDRGHTGWIRVADPFQDLPFPRVLQDPNRQAPMTVFRCADGVLRLFSGDFTNSPYKQRRDPLYCWDVDPVDFSVTRQQVVFDSVKAGVFPNDPRLPQSMCFASVIPNGGGNTQYVVHRVMCFRYLVGVEKDVPAITPEQLANAGIYCARIRYTEDQPPAWQF